MTPIGSFSANTISSWGDTTDNTTGYQVRQGVVEFEPLPESNIDWLNRRVDEMRVAI